MKKSTIDLSRNALLVKVTFTTCGGSRRIPKTEKDKMADAISVAHEKVQGGINLLPRQWKLAFDRIATAGRNVVTRFTTPWDDTGARMLLLSNRDAMLAALRTIGDAYEAKRQEFAEHRDEALAKSKEEITNQEIWGLYEFPTPEQIRQGYTWSLIETPIVDTEDVRLSSVSQEVVDGIVAEEMRRRAEAFAGSEKIIVTRIDELVHRVYETLVGKDEDAIFHHTMIKNCEDQFPVLRNMNAVTGNTAIESLLDEACKIILPLDPSRLRSDKAYRKAAADDVDMLKCVCIQTALSVGAIVKPALKLKRTQPQAQEPPSGPEPQAEDFSGLGEAVVQEESEPKKPEPADDSSLFSDL